jgi:hypothetical protein
MYYYLIGSLSLLLIWLVIFLLTKKNESKKELLIVSLITSLGGFLEPFFVPEYWNPVVLVRLYGFDIESFIFSFTAGGIAVGLYQLFLNNKYEEYKEKNKIKYYINRFLIIFPIILTIIASFLKINIMYSIFVIITIQIILVAIIRKDLIYDMFLGMISFALFYKIFCLVFINIFDKFLDEWSIFNLSGIIIYNVPIEEIIWAGYFGTFAAIIYKYIFWKIRIKKNKKIN